MSATAKLKGFTSDVLMTLATDPTWSVIMSIMTADELINGKVNRIRDGGVNLPLNKYDLAQIEDLFAKGLTLDGLLKVAIETAPAKADAAVPAYIDKADYPIYDTKQSKDEEGNLLFKEIIDPETEEVTQGDPIMESFDTGVTRKKMWKEVSGPQPRNDGLKVMMFPSLTLDQYTKLKTETGMVVKSLKDWDSLKSNTTLTGYGSKEI